jgi:hypothetical protein
MRAVKQWGPIKKNRLNKNKILSTADAADIDLRVES